MLDIQLLFLPLSTTGTYLIRIIYNNKLATTGEFTIYANPEVSSITLNATKLTLNLNESYELKAIISPDNVVNKNILWSSSNPSIVSVDTQGKILAKDFGTATITARAEDGGKIATCIVNVPKPIISVQSITINKTSLTLVEGKTETLIATITPDNATNKTFSWVSTNPKVATVDSNGKVTAISVGTAKIIANAFDNALGTKQAICEVTVVSSNITSETYKIENNIISNIPQKSDLCEFLADLQIPISYKVYDSTGNEVIYTTTVCTGMYIELENGTCYSLVVEGDVSGDGKISATDIFTLKKHITSIQKLDGVYKNAADLNESSTVTVTDLLKMKKVVVGLI